ncbi:MAG: ATP-binding protein [Roseburia sp.]
MSLNNSQYDTLIRAYNTRQFHNQHIQEARRREVYAKSPRLEEIDSQTATLSVECTKRLIAGDEEALTTLHQQLSALKDEKAAIIHSLGYEEKYLDPVYTCPDCKDTGFIGNKRCHCFVQAAIDLVYTQSNIKEILERENFSNFSFKYYSKDQINPSTGLSAYDTAVEAVEICKQFIRNFGKEFSNLFFYGETGVGKTFLSNCVAKELLDRGHSVIYFTSFQLFDILEKSKFQKDADAMAANQNLFDCDLLIIDDLGTEIANSFTVSQLFLCLNERMLRKKSTLISTNLHMNELADIYSERTCSRIFSCYTMIKLFGDDIRLQKKLH